MFAQLKITLSAFRGKKIPLFVFIFSFFTFWVMSQDQLKALFWFQWYKSLEFMPILLFVIFIGTGIFLDSVHTMTYEPNWVSFVLLIKINQDQGVGDLFSLMIFILIFCNMNSTLYLPLNYAILLGITLPSYSKDPLHFRTIIALHSYTINQGFLHSCWGWGAEAGKLRLN